MYSFSSSCWANKKWNTYKYKIWRRIKPPLCQFLLPYDLISPCYIISESSSFVAMNTVVVVVIGYVVSSNSTPSRFSIIAKVKTIIIDESRMIVTVTNIALTVHREIILPGMIINMLNRDYILNQQRINTS